MLFYRVCSIKLVLFDKESYLWYDGGAYFYNQNVEVDFVVYDEALAFQVSYSLNAPDTEKREVDALIKLNKVLPMRRLTIITKEEEREIKVGEVVIHVVPIWKWMLAPAF